MLAHLPVKGFAADSKLARRLGHIAPVVRENLDNPIPLVDHDLNVTANIVRQNRPPAAIDDEVLNHIPQFADIARPRIALKELSRCRW